MNGLAELQARVRALERRQRWDTWLAAIALVLAAAAALATLVD